MLRQQKKAVKTVKIGTRELKSHAKRYLELAKRKWRALTGRKRGFPANDIKCKAFIGNHQRYYVQFTYKRRTFASAKAIAEHLAGSS